MDELGKSSSGSWSEPTLGLEGRSRSRRSRIPERAGRKEERRTKQRPKQKEDEAEAAGRKEEEDKAARGRGRGNSPRAEEREIGSP